MTNDDEHSPLSRVIWENVRLLMLREYGKDNLTRLGKETGISTGGAQRLQQLKKVGPTVLTRVAERFKVEPWQLLAPRLGADLYWRDQQNRFTCVYTAPLGELPADDCLRDRKGKNTTM